MVSGFQLWDLGSYPGLVEVKSEPRNANDFAEDLPQVDQDVVVGEVFRVGQGIEEDHLWRILDDYEECTEEYTEPWEYRREVRLEVWIEVLSAEN